MQVDDYTLVPKNYVKDGKIVLNISVDAVKNLHIGNEDVSCSGRFGGAAHQIMVPINTVIGIFAKENGQGLVFQGQDSAPTMSIATESNADANPNPPDDPAPQGKPKLRIVK